MKKLLLPLFAVVAFAFSAAAQTTPPPADGRPPRSPQEMAGHQTERLSKDLNLSADQSAKVQQILTARAQDMQAARATSGARPTHAQRQASRASYDDQFKQVLTPEQFTKYTAMQTNRHHRGPAGPNLPDGKLKAKDGKMKFKAKPTDS